MADPVDNMAAQQQPPAILPASPAQIFTSNVPLPPPLALTGNIAKTWKNWRQTWEAYQVITGLSERPQKYRVATFITCIGPEAMEIHNGLPFQSEEEKQNIEKVIELWNSYCIGKTNTIYERYKFNNRFQEATETVDTYSAAIRTLADTCEFGALKEELIRDRIVCGISDKPLQRKLLQESSLTLEKCLNICRAAEAANSQLKQISHQSPDGVHQLRQRRKPPQPKNNQKQQLECMYCGRKHERGKDNCPAYRKTCNNCSMKNHFSSVCQQQKSQFKSPGNPQHSNTKVHEVHEDQDESSDDEIWTLTEEICSVTGKNRIYAGIEIGDKVIRMQVDTGASCNVLPHSCLPSGTEIMATKRNLITYSKSKLNVLGTAMMTIRNPRNNAQYTEEFVVVEDGFMPLLGAKTAQKMELLVIQHQNILQVESTQLQNTDSLTEHEILSNYSDLFTGLGKIEGKLHLEVDETVTPVVMPPRRVPIAVKGKLREELDRLEGLGVLTKEEEPTAWVSGLVAAMKPSGKVRVCIDPQRLNVALRRRHYPLPVIEEILPELAKAKVFTKADLKDGFLQIQLDEESSKLTTFQTPWGRYRWLRMPYGISPAPECFQQKLDQCLEGLTGMYKIADDILIIGQGDTEEEADRDHDRNLRNFLDRCRAKNIRLNKDKFELKCKEVSFIGHVMTKDGLKPDPRKVEAITKMERPADVLAVQRFVGLVKYLSKFLKDLSEMCEPLRRLTHKDAEWNWTDEQEAAFERIKEAVVKTPVLRYFNESEPTEGQGDASQDGLGFALLQNGQPVTFASRALTPAERRYAQIEKELLAQVFGMEHNHQYVYGRKVILWTDHKPLVSITQKPLTAAPKRLQRLLLRLQQYDYEIRYKPGREMVLADTLSRAYLDNHKPSSTEVEVEHIHAAQFLPIPEHQLKELQKETASDATLQVLKNVILDGFPDSKEELPASVHPYFSIRDELSVVDGIVFKGLRCVIPQSLRPKMKTKLHESHIGVQGCLRRARELVYWPGMNAELTDYMSKCDICLSSSNSQGKEPLISHEIPSRPWKKVATDIFTLNGKDYLCTVDYYSGYFEVDSLSSKTGTVIISKLKKHFATHGIPNELHSDNGPPYNSVEYANFMRSTGVEHITSSPLYAQSNGRVENAVKTAKNLLKKSTVSGTEYYLSLLNWRNTPTEGMNTSPAQRMFGRRTRTQLPTVEQLLEPRTAATEATRQQILRRKEKQAYYYNQHTKELPPLKEGEVVRVAPRPGYKRDKWIKGQVDSQVDVRSYRVRIEDGRVFRRNRRHLRSSKELFYPSEPELNIKPQTEPEKQAEQPAPPTTPRSPLQVPRPPLCLTTPQVPEQPSPPVSADGRITRSGRLSKQPNYLKDYAT